MQPRIGITAGDLASQNRDNVYLNLSYVKAIQHEGGLPFVLPSLPGDEDTLTRTARAYMQNLDGLLLTGGVDVASDWFNEDPHPHLGRVHPERDLTEITLIRAAMELDIPILAICRGIQVLNVALGGTLWQDIPHQVPGAIQHGQVAPRYHLSHAAEVKPGTRLAALFGLGASSSNKLRINSFHHQAVKDPAPGFIVSAVAGDGIIEAIEKPGATFVVGVQWHPEELVDHHPHFRALFKGLVEAAAARQPKALAANA